MKTIQEMYAHISDDELFDLCIEALKRKVELDLSLAEIAIERKGLLTREHSAKIGSLVLETRAEEIKTELARRTKIIDDICNEIENK